jgi:adenylate cyclase
MMPSFKASLYAGRDTITEIGISKKEFVYHSDSINTTSRISAIAHSLGKNFLISKALCDKLNKESYIRFEDLGEHSLRGKDEEIHFYGI